MIPKGVRPIKRSFRVSLEKNNRYYFRVIEGRKKVFESHYEAKDIMTADAKGRAEFFLSGLSDPAKEMLKKELKALSFEEVVDIIAGNKKK